MTCRSANTTASLGKVSEGWSLSGVTVVQDGTPITIADSGAGTIYRNRRQRQSGRIRPGSDVPGDDLRKHPNAREASNSGLGGNSGGPGYFNAAAFCGAPVIGDGTGYGDSGSGILLGPGQFNWDMSALKTTRITERQVVQFRAEFFNIFNHPQFTNPNAGQGAIYQPAGQGIGILRTNYLDQCEPARDPVRAEVHFLMDSL